MSIEVAELIWRVVGAYLGVGALFAFYFVGRGVDLLDGAAKGSGLMFRLLVFPGAAALWPFLLLRGVFAPPAKGKRR